MSDSQPQPPQQPEIFFGEINPALARIFVRLDVARASRPWRDQPAVGEGRGRKVGLVVGPRSAYASTLPARIPLIERAAGDARLAEAIVPDPCFWSPEAPFLYDVTLGIAGEAATSSLTRTIGIRLLERRGRGLFLEGKAWVPRGSFQHALPDTPLADWHAAGTMMCVGSPTDELCEEAGRIGVLLLARLTNGPDETILNELRRLSQFPAVGIVELPSGFCRVGPAQRRPTTANLLLAERIEAQPDGAFPAPAPWADILILPADNLAAATAFAQRSPLPIIAERRVTTHPTIEAARSQCDHLQRDLAGPARFAAYLV